MRILFLDVDGVLNDGSLRSGGGVPLSSGCVGRLLGLLDRTGARVVVSSTWRLDPRDMARLGEAGVLAHAHPDSATPDLARPTASGLIIGARRGDEIAAWLAAHPEVRAWAVVDDEDAPTTREQRERFVRTDDATGLTDADVFRLAQLLGPP